MLSSIKAGKLLTLKHFRDLHRATKQRASTWWSLSTRERPKHVLNHGLKKALKRCWIHLLPVMAVSVVAALNIKGYFIGVTYLGNDGAAWQTFDVLGLQIAAKIMVVLQLINPETQ